MPPCSLKYCTASMRPWAMSFPWSDVGPVRSTRMPSLMVWASAKEAPMHAAKRLNTRSGMSEPYVRFMGPSLCRVRTVTLAPVRRSIGVRPQGPVALDPEPDACEPQRLVHQEEDDGQPEDDVPRRRDEPEGVGIHAGGRRRAELQHFGQERHEHRAEDGSENAAHAADDDHREVVDGHEQGERVGEQDAGVVG